MKNLATCLKPGGVLVVDHINRKKTERSLVAESTSRRHGMTIIQQRFIQANRVNKTIHVTHPDGSNSRFYESVRLYDPVEFRRLFEASGLHHIKLQGGYNGEPFSREAPRMIGLGWRP